MRFIASPCVPPITAFSAALPGGEKVKLIVGSDAIGRMNFDRDRTWWS